MDTHKASVVHELEWGKEIVDRRPSAVRAAVTPQRMDRVPAARQVLCAGRVGAETCAGRVAPSSTSSYWDVNIEETGA